MKLHPGPEWPYLSYSENIEFDDIIPRGIFMIVCANSEFYFLVLKGLSHGILSYFEHRQNYR